MSFGAFSQRGFGTGAANPFARPNFDFVYEDAGIIDFGGGSFDQWHDTVAGVPVVGAGGSPIATWRNGKRAVTFGVATGNINDLDTTSTELTWLFALQIPPNAGAFTGMGPSSTATLLGKNFPLYFKASTVIGSQPSVSNRDSALDMSPYYGLDAIISVRQAAAGIRFSMRIEGVSGRVITTAAGEACVTTEGISIGGWFAGGGEYPYPIALDGRVLGALSDADQDEAVDWAAWEYDLITP